MRPGRTAQLRNSLKKLAAVGWDRRADACGASAAQEALDYLAMLAGLKPVFLLGRGFDDNRWTDGVLAIARAQDLRIVEGPYWDAGAAAVPGWLAEHVRSAVAGRTAWYICRTRATADEVVAVCADGRPTVAQEARLLGYPECCVSAHYARMERYQVVLLDILRRKAGGDEREMRRLLAAGGSLVPETTAEQSALDAATTVAPCPFTSVNMCAACTRDPKSPARTLSRRYQALAKAVDRGLAAELARNAALFGHRSS